MLHKLSRSSLNLNKCTVHCRYAEKSEYYC